MAHHSIGSIREMVRQYREELSCQTAHCVDSGGNRDEKRLRDKTPVSVKKLCWHEDDTPIHARTGTCTPLEFRMVNLEEFQDLDRRAAEVLRRSQPVLSEGRQAAPVSTRRPHSPNRGERRSDRNRDVVARNFEEIDKILGESSLIMRQSSSSDTKVLSYTKGGIGTQGMEHVKQDVEAREVAAIKAANDYLNKSNGHSNIRLLENISNICAEEVLITNTNNYEVSLPSSCNGTEVYESTTISTTLLYSKRVPIPESERHWLSEGEVDFVSKGTWKYAENFNLGKDSTQSLDLAVETQQFPKRKSVKKLCNSRDMSASFGHDCDLLVSESQSCTGRDLRIEVSCLELDDMKQLSTEDLLLILENPRKARASLRKGRETYISPGKPSTPGGFERSFKGTEFEEARAYTGILASVELQEAFDRTSAPASRSHRYVLKPDKCRVSKDKGNRSPAWMQSLNVRKTSKWRAMSNTHTRSAASLIKSTVAVEELEKLALHCNQTEGAATVNYNNFKTILQEDTVDYQASTPNDYLMFDHCKKSHSPASNELPKGIVSLPTVHVPIRENPHVSIAQKGPRFDVAPTTESTFSSGLNSLISEVVQEWVEECSSSSPSTSVSPHIGPINDGQALENIDLAVKKTLPTDSELVKVARKKSVEALASVVQALQDAEVDEAIVTEFEADETVRLLLEKLHLYEKRIRAMKKREDGNFETENSAEN